MTRPTLRRPPRPLLPLAALLSGAPLLAAAPQEPAPSDDPGSAGKTEWDPWRADAAAPFGVTGDRTFFEEEWTVGLRYERARLSGLRVGSRSIAAGEAFDAGYTAAPTEMTAEALWLSATYAPSDVVSFTMSLPWVSRGMDNLADTGETWSTSSGGVGDARLAWLFRFVDRPRLRAHANLGLGVPTGSINEDDAGLDGGDEKLPYSMQLGTGTFDLQPGVTFTGQLERWSWGAQALYTLRLGRNPDEYRFGDALDVNVWGARAWTRGFSTSLRLRYLDQGAVEGVDAGQPTLDQPPGFPSPANDPALQGGRRIDLGIGLNTWIGGDGLMSGNRFGAELLLPLDQDLDGPQLEQDWALVLGWQYTF